MAQKAFLRLLMLFLAFSYVLSISAVPTTRSLMSNKEDPSVKDLLAQGAMDLKDGEELLDVGEGFIEGRMDFETTDYKGIGANPEHEPKTPGKP
ncbi:Cyclin/Brf1 TBP-binding protein [Fagus crenata]